jgi:hypothetical protein
METGMNATQVNNSVAMTGPALEVLATTVRIHDLTIERPAIAAYLDHIAPGKQQIALVHALEVGITELAARRERFKK